MSTPPEHVAWHKAAGVLDVLVSSDGFSHCVCLWWCTDIVSPAGNQGESRSGLPVSSPFACQGPFPQPHSTDRCGSGFPAVGTLAPALPCNASRGSRSVKVQVAQWPGESRLAAPVAIWCWQFTQAVFPLPLGVSTHSVSLHRQSQSPGDDSVLQGWWPLHTVKV